MNNSRTQKIAKAALVTSVMTGAIVAAVPAATQAEETKAPSFSDVKNIPAHHFYEGVMSLAERGVISGYEDGTFRPGQSINRMHAAKIMALALNLDTTNVIDPGFKDVSKSNPYYGHIAALVEAGIISGYEDNTFKPTANLSRAHMAKMIVLGFEFEQEKLSDLPFTDINDKQWHADFIQTLYSNQITTGTTPTTFSPNALVTRGQMASFIYRSEQAEQPVDQNQLDAEAAANEIVDGAVTVARGNYATAENKLAAVQAYVNGLLTDKEVKATVSAGNAAGEYAVVLSKGEASVIKTVNVTFEFAAEDRFVTEVNSLNATQVEVKFSTAVDAATVFANKKDGVLQNGILLTSLDNVKSGELTGKLSADGKTLVVTAANNLSKRYDVVVDKVKTTKGEAVDKYAETIIIAEDKTAPAVKNVERISASQVKVTFTEPLKELGKVTANGKEVKADGTGVTGSFAAGSSEVIFTMGSDSKANEEITVTMIGAKDMAGNLMTPNPATVTISKGAADGVAPTVVSINQTGAKTFAVAFSEELVAAPTVKIGDKKLTVEKDEKNPTVYNVTSKDVLDEATTVEISSITDLSGEKGADVSKVVTFVKDINAPKVVSSAVVTDEKDLQEYLEIQFDKDVELTKTATVDVTSGKHVKDFVTTTLIDEDLAAKKVEYKDEKNKKVVRVSLASLLKGKDVEGAAYTLNVKFTNVSSAAGEVASNANVSFLRGKDGTPASEEKIAVKTVVQGNTNDSVIVTFDQNVDAESATKASNYTIAGAVVESATVSSDAKDQVQLKLKTDSNTFSGDRYVTIENVKAAGSTVAMDAYKKAVDLTENVAPTVEKAVLTGTQEITLTFSEAVTATNRADFELLVGGTVANKATTSKTTGFEKTVIVKLNKALTAEELAKGLALQVIETNNIKDEAGNKVRFPMTVSVQQ